MAYETKKLVMAVAGGILIAILIISGFVWTGMLPLQLRNVSTVLAAGKLPMGNYTEIRFQIVDAWANITGNPHQPLNITAPWVMLKINFTIEEDSVTSVMIEIDVKEEPIFSAGILMPVAKATID